MSYLSDLKKGVLSPLGFVKKSAGWLARQVGLDDDDVDELVAKADAATDLALDDATDLFSGLLAQAFPALPEKARQVIAHRAAMAGLEAIDTAVSAAGAVIKKAV
jgi:hypothetical protein